MITWEQVQSESTNHRAAAPSDEQVVLNLLLFLSLPAGVNSAPCWRTCCHNPSELKSRIRNNVKQVSFRKFYILEQSEVQCSGDRSDHSDFMAWKCFKGQKHAENRKKSFLFKFCTLISSESVEFFLLLHPAATNHPQHQGPFSLSRIIMRRICLTVYLIKAQVDS